MNFYDKERSSGYLEGIFETASEGIFIVDANGHITRSNPAFDRLLGYEKDELKGKLFTEIAHKDAKVQKITSQIKLHHFQRSSEFPLEMELRDKEGNATPVKLRSSLTKDDRGELIEAIGMVDDLREAKGEEIVEQKIWETQENLQNVLANSGDTIMVADANGRITIANDALLQMLGYQEDDILGKHLTELSPFEGSFTTTTGEEVSITEEYVNYQVEKANELFEKGRVANYELYFIRKDGKIVPIETTISLLKDQKGERRGSIAICRDITERKRAEDLTKLAYSELNQIFNTTANGMCVIDKDFNVLRINKTFSNLLGVSEKDVIGKKCYDVFPSSICHTSSCYLTQILGGEKYIESDDIKERKDGTKIPCIVTTTPFLTPNGELTGIVQDFKDITEREKSEKEIRESRDFLENIFKTTADGIIITDFKGFITMANEAVEKTLGCLKNELIGKSTVELTPKEKEFEKKGKEFITKLREEGIITGAERVWSRKDGSLIDIEVNSVLLKDNEGNITGAISSIRDITKRKKMEKQLLQSEKLKSLGELAGGVAHDFNNILAAILGRAQLLKMSVETPQGEQERRKSVIEMKKGLEIIESAAKDGAETVRRIQEFSRRREEDKYYTSVDINEAIDNALEFTKVRWKDDAESKGINYNIQKEFSSLAPTSGSAAELREVFTNIINNAIDAMPQGGSIRIKTFKEDSHIAIEVKDTGVGIPKVVRDRIFDPFFTTKGVQSSGLGLSVSYGIISRHRGTITVDSIEGKRTTFIIKLPISEPKGREEKVIPMPGEERKARILVIEDEEDVRQLLSDILITGGHEVEIVLDGSKGVKIFKKKEFDLVFTDLGMPRMSGWQVAEKIKGINKSVPVALITGWNVELNESEMRKSGVDLLVYKPFEVNQVLKLVQEGMILRDRFKAA